MGLREMEKSVAANVRKIAGDLPTNNWGIAKNSEHKLGVLN